MKAFLKELDLSPKSLKKFGITIFICLFLIGLTLLFRHKPAFKILLFIGSLFLAFSLTLPRALKPVYQTWMLLAFCLGWINTRVILCVLFYLLMSPIGLMAKVFGKDFLNLRWEKDKETYWIKRNTRESADSYERMF